MDSRGIQQVPVGSNFSPFLEFIGFRFEYEYIQKGLIFRDVALETRVYQIGKLSRRHDLSSVVPLRDLRWIVELRSLTTEDLLPTVETQLINYATSLEPLVKFWKDIPQSDF